MARVPPPREAGGPSMVRHRLRMNANAPAAVSMPPAVSNYDHVRPVSGTSANATAMTAMPAFESQKCQSARRGL